MLVNFREQLERLIPLTAEDIFSPTTGKSKGVPVLN
jgi:hypothetical protein